jgi:hypothetical protein
VSQFSFAFGICWKPNTYGLWKKIKHVEVRQIIFDYLRIVMFISINPKETIVFFKTRGKEKVVECFHILQLGDAWTKYFWAYQIANLVHTSIIFKCLLSFFYSRCNTSCFNYSNYNLAFISIMHLFAKLWMVGLHQMLHLSQDTEANIISYYCALKW